MQSAHAAIDFQHEHPEDASQWQTKSNYLALLTVADEEALIKLISKALLLFDSARAVVTKILGPPLQHLRSRCFASCTNDLT